jgi:hypothetical protein
MPRPDEEDLDVALCSADQVIAHRLISYATARAADHPERGISVEFGSDNPFWEARDAAPARGRR